MDPPRSSQGTAAVLWRFSRAQHAVAIKSEMRLNPLSLHAKKLPFSANIQTSARHHSSRSVLTDKNRSEDTMHIVTGLGQIFKPRPKVTPKLPPKALQKAAPRVGYVAKNGHRRFCGAASGATVSCDLTLKAKFRRSFEEFSAKSKMPTQNGWKDLPHDDS